MHNETIRHSGVKMTDQTKHDILHWLYRSNEHTPTRRDICKL